MTRIILVRHGQTEWNRAERFRGLADVPLNEIGLAQAEATGRRVASGWQVSAVYSSPLARAVKTAEAIARPFNLPVRLQPLLTDIDYGEWQGLSPDEVRANWPVILDIWYNAPGLAKIPGGESLFVVQARGMTVVRELVDKHPTQTIVLVGHTVINRAILLSVLGLSPARFWHLGQDTCALNIFESIGNNDFILKSLNDTCHLHSLSQD